MAVYENEKSEWEKLSQTSMIEYKFIEQSTQNFPKFVLIFYVPT